MIRVVSAVFLFLVFFTLNAQKRWGARDVIRLEDADIYLEITDYKSALKLYLPLYEEYGGVEDMEFKIGLCYFGLNQREEAREYFSRARENGKADAYYYLALYNHSIEEFKEAISLFQQYKNLSDQKQFDNSHVDRMISISERAQTMTKNPVAVRIYNIGQSVNSTFDDYAPLISADESIMVFTSRRQGTTGNKKDPYGEYLEDIYYSVKKGDEWQSAVNMGPPLNSSTHDAAVGISPDGEVLITYRTNKELSAGDLYISHYVDGTWAEPELMTDAINSEYQEASASLTQDERVIYFTSNRPGGFGGKDIYRIVRLGNNQWSLPLNLGPTINTEYEEDAPFIHSNGTTLYFSSKGHNTMGGYDIFSAKLGDGYWSTPENLGYPVNTVGDDIFFVLAADGKRGYYSTQAADGFGGHDIYAVSFENTLERLRVVKGNISDQNGNPLTASIVLLDENGNQSGIYNTNPINGNYIIILPPDEDFHMVISAEGFEDQEDDLFYQGGTNIKEKVRNFKLDKSGT